MGHAIECSKVIDAGGADGPDGAKVFHEGFFALGTNARNVVQD